ncbi:MAG: hypothetical protein PWQ06_2739 [Anaerophaga sp.]|nr:hypothetical protein [Anaerophaga sp.]
MGTFFIFMTMLVFGILISIVLNNIQKELEYRNTLLEKQNEILERERK